MLARPDLPPQRGGMFVCAPRTSFSQLRSAIWATCGGDRNARDAIRAILYLGRRFFFRTSHSVHASDHKEEHKRDDQKLDYGADEKAVVYRRQGRLGGFSFGNRGGMSAQRYEHG